MLDEYVYGRVERISPEAPVPVVEVQKRHRLPGGAGNVVGNLASLGARPLLAGVTGQDPEGDELKHLLSSLSASPEDICLVDTPERPTTCKTRVIAEHQQVCRMDREDKSPLPDKYPEQILDFVRKRSGDFGGIIFSDYDKGVVTRELIEETTAMARKNGVFVAVDPQVTHFGYYREVDVLTPNHHEAGRFLGRELTSDAAVEEGGREILERLDARMLLLTRGEKGMALFESSGCRHFPTFAREVYDVTGAGDTVISLFTLAMVCGATPEEATLLSNQGAGLVVAKMGAATLSVDELARGS